MGFCGFYWWKMICLRCGRSLHCKLPSFLTDSLVHDWQTKGQSSLLVKVLKDQSSDQEAMQMTLRLLWKPMRMPDRDVGGFWSIDVASEPISTDADFQ